MNGDDARPSWITRDRLITGGAIVLASALAWWWLAASDMGMGGDGMDSMPSMGGMTASTPWTPAYAFSVFLMWSIMMVAMMLPSAAPMILLYARVAGNQGTAATLPPTFVFAGAYVAAWMLFSALATTAQWAMTASGLLTDAIRLNSQVLGGALLISAGLFQLTPLKRICLAHCRAPIAFLTQHWRPGFWGALRMGVHHGTYCIGCCWFIMALLFVGGVMNLIWVVAIAAFVMVEKLLPAGERIGQAAGILAVAIGGYLSLTPILT